MDSTKTIDCIEWCFGYGGNHIGLKRVVRGLRCIAASEIEAYAVANMVAKMECGLMDAFPVWTDCKTFPCELFKHLVDLFIASYPCQPFSNAGKRKGHEDARHLWPSVRRAVEIIRPRAVFFENVEGHISLGLREVLTELALLRYRVENSRGEPTWGVFSAAEEGAPQGRKRVFIYAEDRELDNTLRQQNNRHNSERFSSFLIRTSQLVKPASERARVSSNEIHPQSEGGEAWQESGSGRVRIGVGLANTDNDGQSHGQSEIDTAERGVDAQRDSASSDNEVLPGVGLADSGSSGQQGRKLRITLQDWERTYGAASECCSPWHWPKFVARPGEKQHDFEPPRLIEAERGLGGGANGRSSNVDRLRLLGNGVYPATAAKAFLTLVLRASL